MREKIVQGFLWLCLLNIGLVRSIIEPGYLDFDNLPDTNFSCVGKVIGGYYADLETSCQMFHVCTIGQLDEPMDIRFLCLNGTVFDQETRVCERVDEVDCSKSERFYSLNLELYGNTAPPIVEEPDITEPPKKPTTTTTTTQRTTSAKPTRNYFTTAPSITSTHGTPKVITSHHFPVNGGPDIRFNPEEINIRLTPGSPPIIKSPPLSFQQKFSGEPRTVTTHRAFKDDRARPQASPPDTPKPKSVVSYGLQHTPTQNYHYDYNYQQTETSEIDYQTDLPSNGYIYNSKLGEYEQHTNIGNKEYRTNTQQNFGATKTPAREDGIHYPSSSLKPPQIYHFQRTDKPPLQLPIPLLPTLPPLTFSSPAPFTLSRHFETKRSNDHQLPRVVVSASASVSDASGRKVNYSLGTIGASQILGKAPNSYDEYKEDDVGLDPFYHDVPKLKTRQKRDVIEISTEQTTESTDGTTLEPAVTHWLPPDYVDDNYEPDTYKDLTSIKNNKSKISDYIDDNYEPKIYEDVETTTQLTDTTTEITDKTTELTDMTTELTDTTTFLTTDSTEEQTESTPVTEAVTTTETTTDVTEQTSEISNYITESITTTETIPSTVPETTEHNMDNEIYDAKTTEGTTYETTSEYTTITTEFEQLNATTELYTLQSDATEPSIVTTSEPLTTTSRYSKNRGTKRYRFKPTRPQHRFSSPSIRLSQSVLRLQGSKLPSIQPEVQPKKSFKPIHYKNKINKLPRVEPTAGTFVPSTDAALSKSVNPTQEETKTSPLPTTPLTRFKVGFTCIGRDLSRFYEDPRDCRLFHYCTAGYTSTQVLDMKFVCDFGTYFDLDKLICTKHKPKRCK